MPRRKKKNKNKNSKSSKGTASQRCGPKGAAHVVDGVYISGEHFAQDRDRLSSLGITSIVACGCRSHHPDRFRYLEIHLSDRATSNVSRYLDPAADFIAQSLLRGDGAVLVHCKAGICRSATMIAAYLLKYRRDLAPTLDDALAVIRMSRPCANPRAEFMEALNKYSEQVVAWQEERQGESQGMEREDEDLA